MIVSLSGNTWIDGQQVDMTPEALEEIAELIAKGFNADSLRYVPFGNGAEFELRTGCDSSSKSGNKLYLFEAKTPYRTYLEGINKDELNNLIDLQLEMGRYPGLKVGDAEVGNNNAGNWE